MSCPSGFEVGLSSTCRITCPPEFKYINESGVERCVSTTDNRYSVRLQPIPQGTTSTAFANEQARFLTDFITLTGRIRADQATQSAVQTNEVAAAHEKLKSSNQLADVYSEAIDTLKPLRPPTQPHLDIMNAKLEIGKISKENIQVLQVCLFFIVIALFEYVILPSSIVHGIAFFTMCVGLSIAIYLSNR